MKTALTVLGLVLLVVVAVSLTRLAILAGQVGRYKQYWATERERQPEPGSVRLIVLGDSSAQGIGASRPENSYVGRLRTSIENKTDRPVAVVNLSVSGATARDVLQRQIPKLNQLNVKLQDIIVLTVGGNNAVRNTGPEHEYFSEDITSLLRSLPRQTIIADIAYFGGGRYKSREQTVQQYNDVMHQIATKQGIQIANLYDRTKQRDSWRVYSADLFHPSDQGYQNWHNAFWPLVEKQL